MLLFGMYLIQERKIKVEFKSDNVLVKEDPIPSQEEQKVMLTRMGSVINSRQSLYK